MNGTTDTLEGDLLLTTQLELVTPTTVAGTLYGIAFTLFCLYVHALIPRLTNGDRKRQARFMLVYSAVIMLCGLYSLVSNAWVTQDAYIKHANYPAGPYAYILTTLHSTQIVIGFTCQTVVQTFTTAIQVWRVWVVWSATKYANLVIVFPSLCLVIVTGLILRTDILAAMLPEDKVAELDYKIEIAEPAIQGGISIICTLLISLFLLAQQWRQRKLISKAQGSVGYMKVVAILVESYALESTWLLIRASLAVSGGVGAFFAETQLYIEILAYLLVLYRVASGTAYESQRERTHMSSLHWNRSDHAVTQFEATDEAGGDPHAMSTELGAPGALPVSSMA